MLLFLYTCFLVFSVTSSVIIHKNVETRIGAGHVGYIDPALDYVKCKVVSNGNLYSVGYGIYKFDEGFGLYGGYKIKNMANSWSGGGGIHVVCREP